MFISSDIFIEATDLQYLQAMRTLSLETRRSIPTKFLFTFGSHQIPIHFPFNLSAWLRHFAHHSWQRTAN